MDRAISNRKGKPVSSIPSGSPFIVFLNRSLYSSTARPGGYNAFHSLNVSTNKLSSRNLLTNYLSKPTMMAQASL